MRKTWRRIASVILALAMVVLALPEYVSPVKKAKAAATKRTVYVLTNSITKGEYLFVDRNSRGNGTAMASNGTSITTTTVNVQINQDAAIADIGVPYIDADVEGFPESAVWTAAVEDENMRVKKDDKYYLQFSEANVGGNCTSQQKVDTFSAFSSRLPAVILSVLFRRQIIQ